jgi:hypothetical protein
MRLRLTCPGSSAAGTMLRAAAVLYKWSDNAVAPITCGLSAFGLHPPRVAVLNFGVTIESYT